MKTAEPATTIDSYVGFSTAQVPRTEVRTDELRGELAYGPEGIAPFETIAHEWEGDFDSPYGAISQGTIKDRRHRLARFLDLWVATVPIEQETVEHRKAVLGEDYEPSLYLEFTDSIRRSLEGRINAPLHRFAAVGVARDIGIGRAQLGHLHTAATLDELGDTLLVEGMGFGHQFWDPRNARYLVMNLDRDQVDPSLNVANVIGGLLMAERSWPEAE